VPLLLLAPWQAVNPTALRLTPGFMLFLLAAWWLFTHRIERFWIPALPLAALLAGAGAAWLDDAWWRRMILGVVSVGLMANFLAIGIAAGDSRFFVALEELRTDVGDPASGRPGRVNPVHHYLNRSVRPDRAVLLVGDAQPFDLELRTFYNTCFDDCIFEQLTKGRSAEERREAFRSRNITHVYVNWSEIARYRAPGNYGFTEYVQPAVFEELVSQGVLRPVWPAENGKPPTLYETVR
jgi:hypothetical protein